MGKDEITRAQQLKFLSVEFLIGLIIQAAVFFFIGMKAVQALESRIVTLEAQKVDPVLVGKLENSVETLAATVKELKSIIEADNKARREHYRQERIDRDN